MPIVPSGYNLCLHSFNILIDTTTWTDWFNGDSPASDGADAETPDDFRAAKPWVCDNPVDIQCKTTGDLRYDETDDVLAVACTLQGGINCTKVCFGVDKNNVRLVVGVL